MKKFLTIENALWIGIGISVFIVLARGELVQMAQTAAILFAIILILLKVDKKQGR